MSTDVLFLLVLALFLEFLLVLARGFQSLDLLRRFLDEGVMNHFPVAKTLLDLDMGD